jgi:hypothetical protein
MHPDSDVPQGIMPTRPGLHEGRGARSLAAAAWLITGARRFYRLFLHTNGPFDLFAREDYASIFDRMAWNLLHWRFTIDPEILSDEAFVWHDRTTSYFGVVPALLRLPLVIAYKAYPVFWFGMAFYILVVGMTQYGAARARPLGFAPRVLISAATTR